MPGPLRLLASASLLSLGFMSCDSGKDTSNEHDTSTPDSADDTGDSAPGPCDEAAERLGYRACVHEVQDEPTFSDITVMAGTADELRAGKHLVPARADARLPTLFLDVNAFPLHYDLLVTAFPDLFSGLGTSEYNELILDPENREFYAGTLSLYLVGEGTAYGFTLWDDPADASSTVTLDDVTAAWTELQARFSIGELAFVPASLNQAEAASSWEDPPFPILGLESDLAYEVYNPGVGYGTVRLYELAELEAAEANADFGWQDILVIDQAPTDLRRIVSGIVTGTRQGALSHLNVRSAARGTPNCFVRDPLTELAAWEGQLVRFECGESTWSVAAATAKEAQAWWDSIRPEPVEIPEADLDCTDMPDLLDIPSGSPEERDLSLSRWGSKGTNLGTLYQRIDPDLQLDGFVVPFHYYQAFVEGGVWEVDLGDGAREHSFAETLAAWFEEPEFQSDGALRHQRLHDLRDAMEDSPVDPLLIEALAPRVREVFGDETVMLRFRSSSNAEDSLSFSGAGLYDSHSACLADDLDDDDHGPSLCNDDESGEQTVAEALAKVWASLWNDEAWEERAWYGIDPSRVAMAILVNTRSENEQANIVAFTGNPYADDDRYLVNAQLGDLDVVSAEPGVYPESELLTLEDGEVTKILRVSGSSEVAEGTFVLDDARLQELGAELWTILDVFPVDDLIPEGETLLLDTEWKVLEDGRLIIKQVRTYLR